MLVKLDLRKKAACIAEQYHTVQKLQAPPMSTLKKRFCANRENLQPNQPPGKKPFLHNLLTRSATRPVAARGWQLRSVALWLFRKRSLPHCYWNRWQIQCNSILLYVLVYYCSCLRAYVNIFWICMVKLLINTKVDKMTFCNLNTTTRKVLKCKIMQMIKFV